MRIKLSYHLSRMQENLHVRLLKGNTQQQLDFTEIIEDRHARKSTIISSQLPPVNWFDLFSDETVADAFMDRMIHTSHRIEFKNAESLRKKK